MSELSELEEIFLLYKVTNPVNGKSYVGVTKQKLMRRWGAHVASGLKLSHTSLGRAIKKYGKANFTVELLTEAYTGREAVAAERGLIAEHGTLVPDGYNLTIGGEKTVGYSFSKATREKMGNSRRGRTHSEEAKKKIGDARRGRTYTPEHRAAISRSTVGRGKGVPLAPEHVAKIVAANKNRPPPSAETRAKIGAASRLRVISDEARARMSASQTGRKHSEETKAKMRASSTGRKHTEETRKRLSDIRRSYYANLRSERIDA